jgi:hypothetical protein
VLRKRIIGNQAGSQGRQEIRTQVRTEAGLKQGRDSDLRHGSITQAGNHDSGRESSSEKESWFGQGIRIQVGNQESDKELRLRQEFIFQEGNQDLGRGSGSARKVGLMQGIRVQTGIHDSHRKFRIDAGNQDSSRVFWHCQEIRTQSKLLDPESGSGLRSMVSLIQSK